LAVESKLLNVILSPEEKKVTCPGLSIAFDTVEVFEFQVIFVYYKMPKIHRIE